MGSRVDLGQLKTGEWERLQEITDQFERAWLSKSDLSETVDLGTFLPPADDTLRPVALVELITTDLEIRWRRGQVISLDAYLEKYPELGPARTLPTKLIYEEYRVRQLHGDRPGLGLYRSRFPAQYAELEQLVRDYPVDTLTLPSQQKTPTKTATPGPGTAPAHSTNQLTPTSQPMTELGGGYALLKRIGTGSYGEVWTAEAPGGVQVAIKMITRPIEQAEAKQEQQALDLMKNLRHPYLVQTHLSKVLDDRLFIVMELADGSLRDRLKQCILDGQPGIPVPELIRYMREAAEALDFLHAQKVHHRDIKPENILILQKHAKVADFGLARWLECQRDLVTATATGTPAYMAPEVWKGLISPHSDQYSLAVSYFELRFGRRLYQTKAMIELMKCHTEDEPDLGAAPPAERAVLTKVLSKDPDRRYPSCAAFVEALYEAVAPQLPPGQSSLTLPAVALPSRRRRLLTASAFLAAALLPLFLLLVFGRSLFVGDRASPFLPAGFEKADDETVVDENGRKFYRRIDRVFADGTHVEFILIPKQPRETLRPGKPNLDSFYIMRDKVSAGLFKKFVDENPGAIADENWKKFATPERERCPIYGVTVLDALKFAQVWFGGTLPTAEQWDKAAGAFDVNRGEGPYRGSWKSDAKLDIAVGPLTRPRELRAAKDDVSPSECYDLAGNGLEWTRSLEDGRTAPVLPPPGPKEIALVKLRSRSYDLPDPYRYEFDESAAGVDKKAWRYDAIKPDLGFRVIIEP